MWLVESVVGLNCHNVLVDTFHVCHRRCEMYCGHACLCVCLSVRGRMPTLLHGPGCNLGSGGGCPLVVHYWADLQSMDGLLCCGSTRNAWQSQAVICQAHRTPHAVRIRPTARHMQYACWRRLPSPAITSTRLLRALFHFVHTAGCCNANAKC